MAHDQRSETFRRLGHHAHAGPATHGLANEKSVFDPFLIEDGPQVGGKVFHVNAFRRTGRPAETAVIEGDDLESIYKIGHLLPPACCVATGTVGKYDARSIAIDFIIDLSTTRFDISHAVIPAANDAKVP